MKKMKMRLQKGSVMVLFAVLLPFFIFFMSLVIDVARAWTHMSYLQNVADAAALAGVSAATQKGAARVVPEGPPNGSGTAVTTAEENAAEKAAKKIIKSNTGSEDPFKSMTMELTSTGEAYYYRVEIMDYVPLLLARTFLPDDVLPDGLPIPKTIVAWAMVNNVVDPEENNLYAKLYRIGKEQIVNDNATLKKVEHNDRADRVHQNGNGIYFSESDGKVIRTETVVPKEVGNKSAGRVGTWKYLFIDFEPEIEIDKKKSKTDEFPFDDWNLDMDLTEQQWGWVQYYKMFGLDVNNDGIISVNGESGSRQAVINALIQKFDSINTEEDALKVLNAPITNVVSFSTRSKVRVEFNAEDSLETRRNKLEAWEASWKNSNNSLANAEIDIANRTDNTALGDLVARSADGSHISAYDPLLVKIESEDINKNPSASNNNLFYATSVRELTIKIGADNTDDQYRPLIIYYYGPLDIDGKTSDMGGKRESRLVTLELNKDFKGILFAPNSPVTIKNLKSIENPNGHKITGLIVAKSYRDENGNTIPSSAFSSSYAHLTFNDFDMLDLSGGAHTASDVIITSDQAKHLK